MSGKKNYIEKRYQVDYVNDRGLTYYMLVKAATSSAAKRKAYSYDFVKDVLFVKESEVLATD